MIDITLSSNVDLADYQVRQIFEMASVSTDDRYVRLNPVLKISDLGMDNVNPENIKNLLNEGENYVKQNKNLDRIAAILIENKAQIP